MAQGMALRRNAFWVAILFLLWNIIGIGAFVTQATMDLGALAQRDAYQAHLFATMPIWGWIAYAVAIFSGFVGSVALILRSRWAVPLYFLSLAGIVIQFGRTFLMTDLILVRGWGTMAFPLFITIMALIQIWFAMSLRRMGHLS